MRGRSGQPAHRRGVARGRAIGARRRQGNPGHFPGHQRLRRRPQVRGAALARTLNAGPAFTIWRKRLGELGVWIRLHYVYPYPHVDKVIELMADGRVLPYLDIPFQHASARILKLMKRPAASANTLERIAAWRRVAPDITIRSTFIVGFPGETEQDFAGIARLAARSAARSGGLLRILAGGGRGGQCAAPGGRGPRRSRRSGAPGSWSSPPRSARRALRAKVGRNMQVLIDRTGRRRRRRALLQRRPGDRRHGQDSRRQARLTVGSFAEVQITAAGAYDLEARLVR